MSAAGGGQRRLSARTDSPVSAGTRHVAPLWGLGLLPAWQLRTAKSPERRIFSSAGPGLAQTGHTVAPAAGGEHTAVGAFPWWHES